MREAEKKESMELSQNPWSQAIDNTVKPKTTSFFPLWKLKGNQPVSKMATVCLVHLDEESAKRDEEVEIKDTDGINGVREEVHGAPCMGHKWCPSGGEALLSLLQPQALYLWLLLVRAFRENMQLNCKEGMVLRKGAQTHQMKTTMSKNPQEEVPKV